MTEPHTHGGTDAPECTTCSALKNYPRPWGLNIDPNNEDKPGQTEQENSVRTPVLFRGREDDPSTLAEVIGQGIGAGSVCWENVAGAGEFDSSRAAGILDEILFWIHTHYVPMSTYHYSSPSQED